MRQYINLTSTVVVLNDGRVFPPCGVIARVEPVHSEIENDVCKISYSKPKGLLHPDDGVRYIVSSKVFANVDRNDLVTPATNHPDCIKDDDGNVMSVPCFIAK